MPYDDDKMTESDACDRGAMSLLELNTLIRDAVRKTLPETYWVRAEMSDVRVNAASGHCYLEFVEKDEATGQITAKVRGTIWARPFQMMRSGFEQETGQPFASGLKVLVRISVEMHAVYGYSLNVHDIDPSYTVGDLVRKRKEIIRRLQQEGILELNKALPFPLLPQRIAVVTSPTAAGYEDFADQLMRNEYGFAFYIKLFPAVMQGEKTTESVIAALERILTHAGRFDVVVIIRGGGSVSELSSFDSYPLAVNCARFPLPILTGIGHERDDTALDMVAHTRMKTPTAVASFLIDRMSHQAAQLKELEQTIYDDVKEYIGNQKTALYTLTMKLPATIAGHMERHRTQLHTLTAHLTALPQEIRHRMERLAELSVRLRRAADAMRTTRATILAELPARLRRASDTICAEQRRRIELNEQYIKMASPEYILQRGYTLTLKNGKIIKRSDELKTGDEISIRFSDGQKEGTIR
jgi:exodeoxyribonuclease VII large subunit